MSSKSKLECSIPYIHILSEIRDGSRVRDSILDVAAALDPPLEIILKVSLNFGKILKILGENTGLQTQQKNSLNRII